MSCEMRAFTNSKIIKSLLIPSEEELIKEFPHISQVHSIFVRKIMAPLASLISPEKKKKKIHVAVAMFLFIQMMSMYVS